MIAIAVAAPPNDPQAWSGIPLGLVRGLETAGAQVKWVDARAWSAIERVGNRLPALWPERSAARGITTRRRVARAHPIDWVLQLGSDFQLASQTPVVTYDDMTCAQYETLSASGVIGADEGWPQLPLRTRVAWRARQVGVLRRAKVCTVMSEWTRRSLIDDYGIAAEKVIVIGGGVNLDLPAVSSRDWATPRFLVVARDWRRKNVPLVLDTFRHLLTDVPTATLDIVGDYDGAVPPGVTKHGVLKLGSPEDQVQLRRLFDRATCFVMPSRYEAFGIAYAEAAACGIPSIGCNLGGAPEVIGPGGMTVDPRAPGELLDAMRALADPQTAQRLGALAQAHARNFVWDRVAQRLLDAVPAA